MVYLLLLWRLGIVGSHQTMKSVVQLWLYGWCSDSATIACVFKVLALRLVVFLVYVHAVALPFMFYAFC